MIRQHRGRGFTMIELIIVIVIIGALAVFAMPRMVDTTMWRLRAFGDDFQSRMQSMLRLSLAQRRPIVASINPSGVSFDYASGGNLDSLACPSAVPSCIAEAGTRTVTFNTANSGGVATSSGGSLQVTVSGSGYSQAYQVETDTGLVRALP